MTARRDKFGHHEWLRQAQAQRDGYLNYDTTDFTPKPKPATRWQRIRAMFSRKRARKA